MPRKLNLAALAKLALEEDAQDGVTPTEGTTPTEGEGAAPAVDATGNQVEITLPEGTNVEQVEVLISEEDLVVIETDQDNVEEAVVAGDETVEVADAGNEEVGDVEQSLVTLESYLDVVTVSNKRGGLSMESAAILQTAIQREFDLLGYQPARFPMQSLESHADKTTRPGVTRLAMENLGDNIKAIVAKIVEAVKAIAAKVANFVKTLFDSRLRMEQNANKLIEAGGKLKGAGATQLADNSFVAKLAKGNALPANLAGELTAVNTFAASTVDSGHISEYVKLINATNELQQQIRSGAGASEEAGAKMVTVVQGLIGKGLQKAIKQANELGIDAAPEGTELYTSNVFLGNQIIWAYMPVDSGAFNKLRIGKATLSTTIDKNAKAPALSGDQIVKVGEAVLSYAKALTGLNKAREEVAKFAGAYAGLLGGTTVSVETADKGALATFFAAIRALATGVYAAVKGLHTPAFQIAAAANTASLNYALASVKAHGKAGGDKQVALPKTAAPAAA